jgi:hypothetical protein
VLQPETIPCEKIKIIANNWKEHVPADPGLYFYCPRTAISYPFGYSRIAYIGKAKNLANRLAWHFSVDMRTPLIEELPALAWFYQNYFLGGPSDQIVDIKFVRCIGESGIESDIERLFLGMFAVMFGAIPLCNGSVQRKRVSQTYRRYKDDQIVCDVNRILRSMSEKD